MRQGWRLSAVVGEAVANIAFSFLRTLVMLAAVSGALAALMWSELSFTADVKAMEADFNAAGGYVAIVEGATGVNAAVCENISMHPSVIVAGGLRGGGEVRAEQAPGTRFTRFEVTPGLLAVWDPSIEATPSRAGYLVGEAAAQELGLATGGFVRLGEVPALPVTVIDPSQRNQFASRAILDVVAPTERLDQCWVELDRRAFATGLDWLPSVFAEDQVQVRRNVDRGDFAADPLEMLSRRPQRSGWVAVGGVSTAIIAMLALFRRSETALYRAFGLPSGGLLIAAQIEVWIIVGAAYLIAALWTGVGYTLTFGLPQVDQVILALKTSGKAAAVTVLIAPLIAALAGTGSPALLLKER